MVDSKIDSIPGFLPPLGEEGRDIKHPDPGTPLKNVPEGYWHGSAAGEVNYWKKRALSSEERVLLRLKEIEALKAKVTELEAELRRSEGSR